MSAAAAPPGRRIRVLVVDDSPAACAALRTLLAGPAIDVVGTSTGGEDALALAAALRPDVVTMDLLMPGIDGVALIERLMLAAPTRIVVVSAAERAGGAAHGALEAGALEVVAKPASWVGDGARTWARTLAETIALMADVPVVTRRAGGARPLAGRAIAAIGIASSTGGPPVLAEVLRPLRGRRCPPILIAQHAAGGATGALMQWLADQVGIPALMATAGAEPRLGVMHFAPDGHDLAIEGDRLAIPPATGLHRPSADRLLASLATAYGPRAAGVVLTGMGGDGAAGLRELRGAGGLAIAQEPRTCLLTGMPGAAIAAGAAELVLEPAAIAATLFGLRPAR